MYDYAEKHNVFHIKSLYTAFTTNIGEKYNFAGERHNFWELVIAADTIVVCDGRILGKPKTEEEAEEIIINCFLK